MDYLAGHKLLRKSGKVTQADEALKDKKIILFYFSAHWCPPCRVFTPILNDFYSELVREEEPIEVIFVSSDQSPEEMVNYMEECHADWLAVQHGSAFGSELTHRFEVTGIPTVVVVGRDGSLISRSGRSEITEQGPQIFQTWLAAAKAN